MLPENFKFKTTFWDDFSIADIFGKEAIKDTFKRALKEWDHNLEYLTELVIVLNWKIHVHYEIENMAVARLYNDLWEKAEERFFENFQDEESQRYFFQMTD